MCGIAGIVSFDGSPVLLEELRRMTAVIYHRGPDEDGFYLSKEVGLGMRRLSIIDLETGRQPVRNEDGSVWVVFNGEIYNFRELRTELERRGHCFYTGTDTEVIVHLYEEHGPRCVEKLRGMFVFAVWDERKHTLLLARDRLGIKPLYYAQAGGRLVFGSEMKSLLELPEIERRIDFSALNQLFTSLTTPRSQSIIEGVRKLEPGHLMLCESGKGPKIERYWDVEFRPDENLSEEDFIVQIRSGLEESVRLRMIADVPLGAFLSGGIDSSSVVATMARLSPAPVKTFSVGFTEADYSELEYARIVARKYGTEHHEIVLEPDVLGVIEDIAWYLDEPFGDPSAIPTYMVSRLAGQHVTVVLSGDGGDELFAGYDRYLFEQHERRRDRIPGFVRGAIGLAAKAVPDGMRGANYVRHLALTGGARYTDKGTLFRPHEKRNLFCREVFTRIAACQPQREQIDYLDRAGSDWLSALQYIDIKNYLPLDILTKVDRMSMAHSIEARVPLLDHKFVEMAARIPSHMRLRDGTSKYIFKKAVRGLVPDSILDRPKRGFAIPLGRWFRGELGSFLHDLLLSSSSRNRGILNPDYVERVIQMHQQGRRNLDFQIWTLISFELWCRTFLDRTSNVDKANAPQSRVTKNVNAA